jgi:hypothetical protein
LIRKCLTVSPSKRFTVDDIAAYWWVNLGYKYPPVHYYLTPAMKKNGVFMPSHIPALTFNGRTKQRPSESISTPFSSSAENGRSKSKPKTNGYHSSTRSHRLNSQTSRRTSRERRNGDVSKHHTRTTTH